jgi:benzoyl-CoA reductase/2-hydroxyglutaryl-CoA dehydratase subunit BcrC/BadD/HgdB
MSDKIKFNRKNFEAAYGENLQAVKNMLESMEGIGDYRETCTIAILKEFAKYFDNLFAAVDSGKKMIWLEFMNSTDLFRGFPGVASCMAETPSALFPALDPMGLIPYIEAAEGAVANATEMCPAATGFLGSLIKEILPPCDMVVMPTTPCDSFNITYQLLSKLIDAPIHTLDIPYWQDERSVDYYAARIWDMIRDVEKTLKVKMDWDLCREAIKMSNDTLEYWKAENEMRKLIPCPHGGKVNFYHFLLNFLATGEASVRDCGKFILEDSKKLAAEKKGVVDGGEKARILMYNPDPFWDAGIHDWMEDEYKAVTCFSFFGHATPTLIDPSTPETIVRDYAWKSMNMCMARQYRGAVEYFMDDFTHIMDNWNIDAVIIPALLECKHGQGTHGFARQACRERDMPLLLVEYSPMDPRPVSGDQVHTTIAEFLETQVLPRK